jgi:transcriptional regulator with XRE-family HTH domain
VTSAAFAATRPQARRPRRRIPRVDTRVSLPTDPGLPRETGPSVRTARRRRGLSRRRVSRDAGLRTGELAAFERGRRTMTLADLLAVAGSIGTDVAELLPDGVELEPAPPPEQLRVEDFLSPAIPAPGPQWETLGAEPHAQVERRRVPRVTTELTCAFADVRDLAAGVVACCARVHAADATTDVDALVTELRLAVDALAADPAFVTAVARHRDARAEYLRVSTEAPAPSWRMRAQRSPTG